MERELTQRQQRDLVGTSTAYFQSCGDSCPTEQLTWREAMDVAAVASEREGLRYRLPTMAEWSWARRGGSPAPLTVEEGASRGWYLTNSGGRTAIGCQLPTNALGICDIDGNVQEWTSDYAEPLVAAISAAITAGRELVDPQGIVPGTSLARVRCGSSFMMTPSPRVKEKDGRTSILDIVCSPVSAEQRWLAAGARFALYPAQEQAGGGG
jgi:formylglycine-generating enzyme required for sulfatase activity